MINLLLLYLLYFVVGSVEWFLAICRIAAQLKGHTWVVSLIIASEVILGFFIFDRFFEAKDWLVVIVYASGCATGPWLAKLADKIAEWTGDSSS